MSNKKRKTGLGTDAFFEQTGEAEQPDEETAASQEPEEQPEQVQEESGAEKIKTSVMLTPKARAGMEMLKVQALRNGNNTTYSEIIDEAIHTLMEKKGVEV